MVKPPPDTECMSSYITRPLEWSLIDAQQRFQETPPTFSISDRPPRVSSPSLSYPNLATQASILPQRTHLWFPPPSNAPPSSFPSQPSQPPQQPAAPPLNLILRRVHPAGLIEFEIDGSDPSQAVQQDEEGTMEERQERLRARMLLNHWLGSDRVEEQDQDLHREAERQSTNHARDSDSTSAVPPSIRNGEDDANTDRDVSFVDIGDDTVMSGAGSSETTSTSIGATGTGRTSTGTGTGVSSAGRELPQAGTGIQGTPRVSAWAEVLHLPRWNFHLRRAEVARQFMGRLSARSENVVGTRTERESGDELEDETDDESEGENEDPMGQEPYHDPPNSRQAASHAVGGSGYSGDDSDPATMDEDIFPMDASRSGDDPDSPPATSIAPSVLPIRTPRRPSITDVDDFVGRGVSPTAEETPFGSSSFGTVDNTVQEFRNAGDTPAERPPVESFPPTPNEDSESPSNDTVMPVEDTTPEHEQEWFVRGRLEMLERFRQRAEMDVRVRLGREPGRIVLGGEEDDVGWVVRADEDGAAPEIGPPSPPRFRGQARDETTGTRSVDGIGLNRGTRRRWGQDESERNGREALVDPLTEQSGPPPRVHLPVNALIEPGGPPPRLHLSVDALNEPGGPPPRVLRSGTRPTTFDGPPPWLPLPPVPGPRPPTFLPVARFDRSTESSDVRITYSRDHRPIRGMDANGTVLSRARRTTARNFSPMSSLLTPHNGNDVPFAERGRMWGYRFSLHALERENTATGRFARQAREPVLDANGVEIYDDGGDAVGTGTAIEERQRYDLAREDPNGIGIGSGYGYGVGGASMGVYGSAEGSRKRRRDDGWREVGR
ncbi:hypothetical protein HDU93_005121 [Gonapodya sp. JEL0774]|nr:hypothetical protein HDU93_005121 [Gonapodya sp. JEL0774]